MMSTVAVALNSPSVLKETTERVLVASAVNPTSRNQVPPAVVEALEVLAPPVTWMVVVASAVPTKVIGFVVVAPDGVRITGIEGTAAKALETKNIDERRAIAELCKSLLLFSINLSIS